MGNSYAERVQRDRQRYLDIGLDSGAQIVHDMLCVALRDKQAMGDDVWGRERIVRLLTRLNELKEEFGPAFRPGPEQDYMQEQDRKSTRLNSSHANESRMPSSA